MILKKNVFIDFFLGLNSFKFCEILRIGVSNDEKKKLEFFQDGVSNAEKKKLENFSGWSVQF